MQRYTDYHIGTAFKRRVPFKILDATNIIGTILNQTRSFTSVNDFDFIVPVTGRFFFSLIENAVVVTTRHYLKLVIKNRICVKSKSKLRSRLTDSRPAIIFIYDSFDLGMITRIISYFRNKRVPRRTTHRFVYRAPSSILVYTERSIISNKIANR